MGICDFNAIIYSIHTDPFMMMIIIRRRTTTSTTTTIRIERADVVNKSVRDFFSAFSDAP